jgi:K+-transporting ATPase ATPase A chain
VSGLGIAQALVFAVVLLAVAIPVGLAMARIYSDRPPWLVRQMQRPERAFLRLVGAGDSTEHDWKGYAWSVLAVSAVSSVGLYLLLRLQGHLFLNPEGFRGLSPELALHTTASFVTSTNWQFYAGESTMSHLSQMAGLAVHNFIAPAVGLAVLLALIRGLTRRSTEQLGCFWRDFYRSLVYVLLPIALVASIVLVSQGVPQTFDGQATATTVEGVDQHIARGPVATQVAIRTLGTNGGGFYNANAAVPFENPNGATNLVLLVLQLLIPVACIVMFGRMIGSLRQGWMILSVTAVLFAAGVGATLAAEQHGSEVLRDSGVNLTRDEGSSGGNMQDKEVRFGISGTGLYESGSTSTSGSSVNAGLDAFTPAGGAVALANMFIGVFGGAGSGLFAILLRVIVAVFVAGLMIGRTPAYLGKQIDQRDVKLVAVGALTVPLLILAFTAISITTDTGRASIFNPGPHGFTETLYAYTSQATNNGSAFAGFGANDLSLYLGTAIVYLGRFVPIVAVLALAGSLASKRASPSTSAGTLRTDSPTFGAWLLAVTVVLSGLTILPALCLGPIVEALMP